MIDTEFGVPTIFKLIPFILTVSFSALAIIYSEFMPNIISNFKLSNLGYYIYGFFNQRFLVEFFYNKYIVNSVLEIGGQTTKVLDKGSVESVGPYGFGVILTKASKIISSLSNGVVTNYALYILIGICFYLSIFTFVQVVDDVVNSITIGSLLILMMDKSYDRSSSSEAPNL
jgi:NADH-ubiquinone oxidoreductase chain 5